MVLNTILNTILLTTNPDLCADVYVDASGAPYTDAVGQTWSRYCEWTGPDAPVLDIDVCCTIGDDSARCSLPDGDGRCSTGDKMYCEYGDVTSTGAVVCYQPFTSICEFGFCSEVKPPDIGPFEDALCCWGDGICTEIETIEHIIECGDSNGYVGYCRNGAQNADGTVDCFD